LAYYLAYFFKVYTMETATLSSKGQLVIPRKIRESANVTAGDAFRVHYTEGEIRLLPMTKASLASIDEVAGCLARAGQNTVSEATVQKAILARLKAQDDATMTPLKKGKSKAS
jgi:AbrB family looped-hinge helix DNA binding protein